MNSLAERRFRYFRDGSRFVVEAEDDETAEAIRSALWTMYKGSVTKVDDMSEFKWLALGRERSQLSFNEYHVRARKTAIYPDLGNNFIYPALKIAGEAGEVAEKIGKVLRDHNGVISDEMRALLVKELGDVLWYISAMSHEINVPLQLVAELNLEKLAKRAAEGKLHGSGDER